MLESQYFSTMKKAHQQRPLSQLSLEKLDNEMNSTASESGYGTTQVAKLEMEVKILKLWFKRLVEEKTQNYIEFFKANLSEKEIQHFDPVLRQQIDAMGWLLRS